MPTLVDKFLDLEARRPTRCSDSECKTRYACETITEIEIRPQNI